MVMDGILNILLALILTSVTGNILLILWMLVAVIGRGRINTRYMYCLLKGVIIGYIFPLVYLFSADWLDYIHNGWFIFRASGGFVDRLILLIFFIWVMGMCVLAFWGFYAWKSFQKVRRSSMAAPKEYSELLKKLCGELGIRHSVGLFQGYGVATPFVFGIWHPQIYLPVTEFAWEDLEMILYHELIHYKQRDVLWKPLFGAIANIYWFNPLSNVLWNKVVRWAEANCDTYCCAGRFPVKKYFFLLLEMSHTARSFDGGYVPMWGDGGRELEWRIACMKKRGVRRAKLLAVAIIAVVSVLSASISTRGAIHGIEIGYHMLFANIVQSEEICGELQEEYGVTQQDRAKDNNRMVIHLAETVNEDIYAHDIDWAIAHGTIRTSSLIPLNKGQGIIVAVAVEPEGKMVTIGIVQDGKKAMYIQGEGDISYPFIADKTGLYQFFVSSNTAAVKVNGTYLIVNN